ncbi:phenylacetate--CoA ligase family protein [Xenorhabdus stockiae]|uniref:phenylacetate--CoA ligase family protein n=1 Tax=Xenorhabdus stockiae TaxID=351614 RepID=UPI003CF1F693
MKLNTSLANKLYWVSEKMQGKGEVAKRLQWLEETQYLSLRECRKLQMEKLHTLLTHAYESVPYYTRVFNERGLKPDDFNSLSDLAKLPLLTRQELTQHQAELISTRADHATLQTNYSSGSTGKRACFVQDANFRLWMRAHQLRTYQWCSGWKVGEPFALLWGSSIYWSLKSVSDRLKNLLSNRREFNTFRLSPELIGEFTRNLASFNPVLISTYTNAMHLIARQMERESIRVPALRAIQGTSEPLPPIIRERLQRVFRCEVYDKYGSRETNIVSHESPHHDGMLIQVENVAEEFLRDDGSACQPGETGRVVLTTLNNFAMPLIRYETSDLASPMAGNCTSGLGLPRMSHVAGRQQDLILTPDGAYIDAYLFSFLIMRFEEIEWFQVVQDSLESLRIRLMVPTGISRQRCDEIVERIHHHAGYPFHIEFEQLDRMPDSPTGKFRLCVSALSDIGTSNQTTVNS